MSLLKQYFAPSWAYCSNLMLTGAILLVIGVGISTNSFADSTSCSLQESGGLIEAASSNKRVISTAIRWQENHDRNTQALEDRKRQKLINKLALALSLVMIHELLQLPDSNLSSSGFSPQLFERADNPAVGLRWVINF